MLRLLSYGVHELQEAALLPTLVEHMWDINPILDEHSAVGTFLKALFGYNGSPSLLEVIAYGAYLFVVLGMATLRRGHSDIEGRAGHRLRQDGHDHQREARGDGSKRSGRTCSGLSSTTW